MKRSLIGAVLLAVLLALGILTQSYMTASHSPAAAKLEGAAEMALQGDWPAARAQSEDARAIWEGNWRISGALADHAPMEDIDALFAQLAVFARQEETAEFAACCCELSRRLQAMADAHKLTWYNLM